MTDLPTNATTPLPPPVTTRHRARRSQRGRTVAVCLTLAACQPAERPGPPAPAPLAEPPPPAPPTPSADPHPPPAADLGAPASTTSSEPSAPDPTTGTPTEPAGPCPAGMALVEGGPVSKKQRARWKKFYPEAEPPPPAEVSSFCLDLFEATEADLAASTDVIPVRPEMLPCHARGDCGDKPVEGLSRRESAQYCASRGKRVPTLVEWLWAAGGGTEDRKYPWGSSPPTAEHVNGCDDTCARSRMSDCDDRDIKSGYCTVRNFSSVRGEDGYENAAPVGSFPAGAGRWGHLDLAGNVAESVQLGVGNDNFVCGGSYEGMHQGFDFSLHKRICEIAGRTPQSVRCASEPRATGRPR